MKYSKPSLSIPEQIILLKQRGLAIHDDQRVEHYLTYIGYYRFSAYWLSFEHFNETGRTHRFKSGTSFDDVLSLYIFDRKLRLLVMEAIERIEVAVRTHWANTFSMKHGAHGYLDAALFKNRETHRREIENIKSQIKRSNEVFIQHYLQKYTEPALPPIWAIVETMTFGALSRWFSNTKDTSIKKPVFRNLGLPNIETLESALHIFSGIRNICAHHGRLWNRRLVRQFPVVRKLSAQMVVESDGQPSRKIYNYLLVMAFVMQHINPGSSWCNRVKNHVKSCPLGVSEMGFPEGWEDFAIWQRTV